MTASKQKKYQGYTIVELMVAMTLGLILAAGIIQVFLANRQAQRMEQTLARMQENGRIALDIISQDLRQSGYIGCASATRDNSGITSAQLTVRGANLAPPMTTQFADNSLLGFQRSLAGVWAPALPAHLAAPLATARNGSDAVAVYYGVDFGAKINANGTGGVVPAAGDIVMTRPLGTQCFTQNEIAIISSCSGADVIQVTNTPNCAGLDVTLQHAAAGNNPSTLSQTYSDRDTKNVQYPVAAAARPRVLAFNAAVYFVRNTGRINAAGLPIFSLFRSNPAAVAPQAVELVEGVEFLRIEYGLLLSTGNIRYLTANNMNAGDWPNVISARIGVLIQSYDAVRDSNDVSNYVLAEQVISGAGAGVVHSGGRTLRQAYNVTIELRNRAQ